MLYNVNDNKFSKITKQIAFWSSLFFMFVLFLFLLNNETRPSKKQITVEIDIKNKVNICLPEKTYKLDNRKIDDFEGR